jgi:large subunit ribosomal protein L19
VNVDLKQTIIKNIMADLMKFVQDEFVTRKEFPVLQLETQSLFTTKLERVKNENTVFQRCCNPKKRFCYRNFTIRKMSGAIE